MCLFPASPKILSLRFSSVLMHRAWVSATLPGQWVVAVDKCSASRVIRMKRYVFWNHPWEHSKESSKISKEKSQQASGFGWELVATSRGCREGGPEYLEGRGDRISWFYGVECEEQRVISMLLILTLSSGDICTGKRTLERWGFTEISDECILNMLS